MSSGMDRNRLMFVSQLQRELHQCSVYEDHATQDAARRTVPFEELEEKTVIALAKEGKFQPSKDELDHAKLRQLLLWFKGSFRWVNQPQCENCGGASIALGNGTPNAEDRRWQASRVELFRCRVCTREVRFPRYNDPRKLLETRKGRCGEWANCFTLYCRALGYQTRLVLDFGDHIWTECYLPLLGRWVHADPCEGELDNPLLYEQGWKKKLSYVIAFSHNGVRDVTKRYTRNWPEVLTRRTITTEDAVQEIIMMLNMQMQLDLPPLKEEELSMIQLEDVEIEASYQQGGPANKPVTGRQSGSEEWRYSRGEIGTSQATAFQKKDCPVRGCFDEYVTRFRDAVGCLWADIVESDNSPQAVVLNLKTLHGFVKKLKSQSFRKREFKLHSEPEGAWVHLASDETTMAILEALGLQLTVREDGEFWVVGNENPALTAVSLPVAVDLLERLTKDLPSDVTSKWIVHGSRLCMGVTCASDEELPNGISSAAFDGLLKTKWEEPRGGSTGAWIVYHLPDDCPQKVVAYELTSADDCPARDPRDWVLEGSSDNGKSWMKLDSQQGQLFADRFICKTYEIAKENHVPCGSFRFQFLSNLDPKADGRLQMASIDFITEKNPT